MANKPNIPKGTRDFSPVEMAKRNYIFDTIREVYSLYGFQQIETPAMENLQTLMGKYGEEGDKLLFKILNSGDYLSKVSDEELTERNTLRLAARLCEKGLRYDLTVPLRGMWSCIVMNSRCLSNAIRCNRCGVLTARRKGATVSSISSMAMWLALTRS